MSRRQAQNLISEYEQNRPPLEMLELEAERKKLASMKRNPDYPGVTPSMMRSTSAGVLRFGGVRNDNRSYTSLPSEQYLVPPRPIVRPNTTMGMSTMNSAMNTSINTTMNTTIDANDEGGGGGGGESSTDGLVATLTSQCNELAWRLMAVEQELVESKKSRGYTAYAEENGDVLNTTGEGFINSDDWGDETGDFNNTNTNIMTNNTMNTTTSSMRNTQSPTNRSSNSRSRSRGSPSRSRGRKRAQTENDADNDDGENKPLHPRVLPIQASANQLTSLVTSLTKSLYGDDSAKSEEKKMSDALKQRDKDKRRFDEYTLAKSAWKKLKCYDFALVLKMELDRQRIMREKVAEFKAMLAKRKIQVFLREWHHEMELNLLARKETIRNALDMENRHFNSFLRVILKGWHGTAFGPYSRKGAMDRFRIRMDAAREVLAAKLNLKGEEIGKITKEMIVEEVSGASRERSEPRAKRASHNWCLVLLARFAHS